MHRAHVEYYYRNPLDGGGGGGSSDGVSMLNDKKLFYGWKEDVAAEESSCQEMTKLSTEDLAHCCSKRCYLKRLP